jgi:hypothetical protein
MRAMFKYAGVVASLLTSPAVSGLERDYQVEYCQGEIEVRLPDRTRIDCLTETHAIEFDYARKYAEALGQALYYAMESDKRAGIVLIMGENDSRFLRRLNATIAYYRLPVDVWTVNVFTIEEN